MSEPQSTLRQRPWSIFGKGPLVRVLVVAVLTANLVLVAITVYGFFVSGVGHDWGIFVEAGAFDGYGGSNTYWFERFRGWTGVLIEPTPELAARARKGRPRSQVSIALWRKIQRTSGP